MAPSTPAPQDLAIVISPQGQAIVGITGVTFVTTGGTAAQTYSWNFGDGAIVSGATATHVYDREGIFTVVLTATSGSGSTTVSATVSVGNVTGLWKPDFAFAGCFSVNSHRAAQVSPQLP